MRDERVIEGRRCAIWLALAATAGAGCLAGPPEDPVELTAEAPEDSAAIPDDWVAVAPGVWRRAEASGETFRVAGPAGRAWLRGFISVRLNEVSARMAQQPDNQTAQKLVSFWTRQVTALAQPVEPVALRLPGDDPCYLASAGVGPRAFFPGSVDYPGAHAAASASACIADWGQASAIACNTYDCRETYDSGVKLSFYAYAQIVGLSPQPRGCAAEAYSGVGEVYWYRAQAPMSCW